MTFNVDSIVSAQHKLTMKMFTTVRIRRVRSTVNMTIRLPPVATNTITANMSVHTTCSDVDINGSGVWGSVKLSGGEVAFSNKLDTGW